MRQDKIDQYYYISYECRFCGEKVLEHNLDEHQNECEE